MRKIRGSENWGELSNEFNQINAVAEALGFLPENSLSLVENAAKNKIPLPVLLNNISKKIDLEVEWPKISGITQDSFAASSGLRKGKLESVKNIIAVHSGKGGVGKTMLACSLAKMIAKDFKVGILDLDIDCPNVSRVLNIQGRLTSNSNKKISPLISENEVKVVSLANIFEEENKPVMWRGPIMAKAIEQLFFDTDWGELDYLILDLPPGTSDVPLTTLNICKPNAVILITTGDKNSIIDTDRAAGMYKSFEVPLLGIVENMCGNIFDYDAVDNYFGSGNVIGKIPLDRRITLNLDESVFAIPEFMMLYENLLEKINKFDKINLI